VDWALLYRDDPNRAYREFERTKITWLDPEANFYQVIGLPIPPSVINVSPPSEVVNVPNPNSSFQPDPPKTGPMNTGIPNPPGMTDAQYLEIVEKAKFDSAVIAAANAGRNAKQSNAEVETLDPMSQAGRAKEGSPADIALTAPDPKIGSSKSLVIPAMAVIAAYLMFKG